MKAICTLAALALALGVSGQSGRGGFSGGHSGSSRGHSGGGTFRGGGGVKGLHGIHGGSHAHALRSGTTQLPAQVTGQTFSRSVITDAPHTAITPGGPVHERGFPPFPRGAHPIFNSKEFFGSGSHGKPLYGNPLTWMHRSGRADDSKGHQHDRDHLGKFAHGGYVFPLGFGGGTLVFVADNPQIPWNGQPVMFYAPDAAQDGTAANPPAKEEPIVINFPPGSRVRPANPATVNPVAPASIPATPPEAPAEKPADEPSEEVTELTQR